jgi:glutamate formiminotransferase/formiminotetrahydrofolate cyclodeaminase
MPKIVECVPNFSEGRDREVIDRIVAAIAAVPEVSVLDVDPGAETNRTVVTFIGPPDAVVAGAFAGIAAAAELIDMRRHKGAHPRMGATDVCPFVPVSEVTMEDCVALARELGRRVGEELGIPVYLYEYAATSRSRVNLADIRAGEYEGLARKMQLPEWRPDFGPAEFNARSGATVIGARQFLIAYNVNLNTRDRKLAMRIASRVREKGYIERDARGRKRLDEQGNPIMAPGLLKKVKGAGWYIPEYGCAQVSYNLTDYHVTPLHVLYETTKRVAEENGVWVTGSELVGLTPLEPLRAAGRHFLAKQGRNTGVSDAELIHVARLSLGLDSVAPFDPEKKIIDYRCRDPQRLVARTVESFCAELASESPAPGGGSVSALVGGLGAALAAMVATLTHSRRQFREVWPEMAEIGAAAHAELRELLDAVDADTRAFNRVMEAMRLPRKTEEERAARDRAVAQANLEATLVPLGVIERAERLLPLLDGVARRGNPSSLSDAGVGALCARLAAEGAFLNVLINLPGVVEPAERERILAEATERCQAAVKAAEELRERIVEQLRAQALDTGSGTGDI